MYLRILVIYLLYLTIYYCMETTNLQKFEKRTENTIRLLEFLEAKNGKGDELWKILHGLIEPTIKEPGNIAYVPHRSIDNPEFFMFDEIWEDQNAIEEHFKQPHMQNLEERISQMLEKPLELRTYYEIKL